MLGQPRSQTSDSMRLQFQMHGANVECVADDLQDLKEDSDRTSSVSCRINKATHHSYQINHSPLTLSVDFNVTLSGV